MRICELKHDDFGIYSICNIFQSNEFILSVDSAFVGYFNVYNFLQSFAVGNSIAFGCFSHKDLRFPDGLVFGDIVGNTFEVHIAFIGKINLSKKIKLLQMVIELIKQNYPFIENIVGYPPVEYVHARLLIRKLGFVENETSIKLVGMNGLKDCVKVEYKY